jgi:hypothetical protein
MRIDRDIYRFYKGVLSLKSIALEDIKFLSEGVGYFYSCTEPADLLTSGLKEKNVPKHGIVSTRHFIGDGLFLCIPLSSQAYLQKSSFSHELIVPSNKTFELPNTYILQDGGYRSTWWVTEENVLKAYENP